MSSTTNWWQQAKKSHSKLQSAARNSAPLAVTNAEEGSRFVECPACGASMHRQSLNHHLDLDCPVLHGYGDHARGIGGAVASVSRRRPRSSTASAGDAAPTTQLDVRLNGASSWSRESVTPVAAQRAAAAHQSHGLGQSRTAKPE